MYCTRLAENSARKKTPKIHHLGTVAQLCRAVSSQLTHVSTIGKNLLNSNISSRCPHNIADFGPQMAEINLPVWGIPANFNRYRIWALLLQRLRSPEANQSLHDLWSSPGLVRYIYIFWGFCSLTEFCHMQNSLCVQVLRSRILAALLHGTPAVGLSQTLWCSTRNGITELSQRAPPIFGCAAITLGIGPHSSWHVKHSAIVLYCICGQKEVSSF